MFDVIYELLLEVKKLQQELKKFESESSDFYNSYQSTKKTVKEKDKKIQYLATRLSPTYNELVIKTKTLNFEMMKLLTLLFRII